MLYHLTDRSRKAPVSHDYDDIRSIILICIINIPFLQNCLIHRPLDKSRFFRKNKDSGRRRLRLMITVNQSLPPPKSLCDRLSSCGATSSCIVAGRETGSICAAGGDDTTGTCKKDSWFLCASSLARRLRSCSTVSHSGSMTLWVSSHNFCFCLRSSVVSGLMKLTPFSRRSLIVLSTWKQRTGSPEEETDGGVERQL